MSLLEVENDPQISTQIKAGLLKQSASALDAQIAKLRASAKIQKYA
jgi:K+-transporting ATPase c subunit